MKKQTKIVATLGPASNDPKIIAEMIKSGMNVARINFSHGDHAEHGERIDNARKAAASVGEHIAILQDLCGPKIRIGDFKEGAVMLKKGDSFIITTRKVEGDEKIVSVNLKSLPRDVQAGMTISLEDGNFILKIVKVDGEDIHTKVLSGGRVRSRRGLNVPGGKLSVSAITEKDKKDLAFGVSKGVDLVAFSFVQTAKDIRDARALLKKHNSKALIFAKIETQSAIDNLEEIVAEADGIMIARGDLAVEVPKEDVPLLQKQMIRMCRAAGKPVITATQMLDSMTNNPVPTRAEVADVANAVFDGTDAVMLSQESAVGAHPELVVSTMASIAARAETSEVYSELLAFKTPKEHASATDASTLSAAKSSKQVDAKAIVTLTETGFTARMMARHRPHLPILAITPNEETARALAVSFGVRARAVKAAAKTIDAAITLATTSLTTEKIAKKGDTFVLAAGVPFGKVGGTNMTLIQKI